MCARLLLAALIGWLVVGQIVPDLRLAKVWLAADQVTHIIVVYLLTLLAALAFPRVGIGLVALGVACFGGAAELGQHFALLQGNAQWHDFVANFAGVASAALPLWIGRASAVGASEPAAEDSAPGG